MSRGWARVAPCGLRWDPLGLPAEVGDNLEGKEFSELEMRWQSLCASVGRIIKTTSVSWSSNKGIAR